jgi:hypothetical protein
LDPKYIALIQTLIKQKLFEAERNKTPIIFVLQLWLSAAKLGILT